MKTWYYARSPGTRAGLMVCTSCNKPIDDVQFRYHETKEGYRPQHRECSENDPKWKELDKEEEEKLNAAKATLEDLKRIQKRGFWDVSEIIEEIENILSNSQVS
jgi:hypothetical protein